MARTERRQGIQLELTQQAAFELLANLRLSLARVHGSGDPRASAVASQCEEVLATVSRELELAAIQRGR